MLPKLFKWLLGEKLASSLGGLVVGAAAGAGGAAMSGDVSTRALAIGAISGAFAALAGAGGRAKGETPK